MKDSTKNHIYLRTTNGANINYVNKTSGLSFNTAFYWQGGKDKKGTDINAYFVSANAGYNFANTIQFTVFCEYFSGNNELDTLDNTITAFNNLYGTGHGFYGGMDYFTNIYRHTKGGGLIDSYARIDYSPSKKLSLRLDFHYFMLSGNLLDTQATEFKAIDKNLASEIDFSFTYKYSEFVKIKAGYSALLAQKSLGVIKSGDYNKYADWAWFSINFSPKIIVKELNSL